MYFLIGCAYGVKKKPYNIKIYYKTNNKQSKRLKQLYESGALFNKTLAIISDVNTTKAKNRYKKYILKDI